MRNFFCLAFIVSLGFVQAQGVHHGTSSGSSPINISGESAPNQLVGNFIRLFNLGDTPINNGETLHLESQASPTYRLRELGQVKISEQSCNLLAGDETNQLNLENLILEGPMVDDGSGDDSIIPAGITFFGQFVDHDLTLDVVSSLDKRANPYQIVNERNANFDLDSIYGGGREATPFLYENDIKLAVGKEIKLGSGRFDLLRVPNNTAVIGDPRNDENLVISQLQAAFIAFHNRMVEELLVRKYTEIFFRGRDVSSILKARKVQEGIAIAEAPQAAPAAAMANVEPAQENLSETQFNTLSEEQFNAQSREDKLLISAMVHEEEEICNPQEATKIPNLQSVLDSEITAENIESYVLNCLEEVIDSLSSQEQREIFEEARNHVLHYYHRVILEEYLPHVIGHNRVNHILREGREFYFPTGFVQDNGQLARPNIPIEFSVAAFRYGHSQVRQTYNLNKDKSNVPLFSIKRSQPMECNDLMGFKPICEDSVIDWQLFFPEDTSYLENSNTGPQRARATDPFLAKHLFLLPFFLKGQSLSSICGNEEVEASLAARNLNRGRVFRLPSGEDLAEWLNAYDQVAGIYAPFEEIELLEVTTYPDLPTEPEIKEVIQNHETPLWYYILVEAALTPVDTKHDRIDAQYEDLGDCTKENPCGNVLGPVGGLIVGEVIIGLLDHYREQTSKGLDYIPTVSIEKGNESYFSMADILKFTEIYETEESTNSTDDNGEEDPEEDLGADMPEESTENVDELEDSDGNEEDTNEDNPEPSEEDIEEETEESTEEEVEAEITPEAENESEEVSEEDIEGEAEEPSEQDEVEDSAEDEGQSEAVTEDIEEGAEESMEEDEVEITPEDEP